MLGHFSLQTYQDINAQVVLFCVSSRASKREEATFTGQMKDVRGKGTLLHLVSHSVLYHRVMSFFLLREALVWRLTLQCPLAISFLITSQMRQMGGHSGPTLTTCITLYKWNGTSDLICQMLYLLKARYFQDALIVTANNYSRGSMPVIPPLFLECSSSRRDHLRALIPGGWDGEWSLVRGVLQMSEFGEYLPCSSAPFSQHKPQIIKSVAIYLVCIELLAWARRCRE